MRPLLRVAATGTAMGVVAAAAYLTVQARDSAIQAGMPMPPASSMTSSAPSPAMTSAPMTSPAPSKTAMPPIVRYYEVRRHDTLTSIAGHVYGLQADWWYIYQANRNLIDRDRGNLYPAERLVIPPVPGSRYPAAMPASMTPAPMRSGPAMTPAPSRTGHS